MIGLLFLAAVPPWLAVFVIWQRWYETNLVLLAVQVLERILNPPEPEVESPRQLVVASLKNWQTDWGRARGPVSRPSTRGLVAS